MPQQNTILSYLYTQYQDDLDLRAFVDSYNNLTQQYVDYLNTVNIPIYTGLSGTLLDWVGAGLYGFPRPIIGSPTGAIYNVGIYNQVKYGTGNISVITTSDDIYKRILTWKLYRGDGFRMNTAWLKRRMKRFLIGINGTSPNVDNTFEISLKMTSANIMKAVITYPTDQPSVDFLVQYINSGALDLPYQYQITAQSA